MVAPQDSVLCTAEWLAGLLDTADLLILDATVLLPSPRFDHDYRVESGASTWEAAHIPGSRHADLLFALSDQASPFGFTQPETAALITALETLGGGSDKTIVVYDSASGFWAARLWWMLRGIGVTARVLDGGLSYWRQQGLPLAKGPPTAPQPGRILPCLRPELWADRRAVEQVLCGERSDLLVCVLTAPVFAGTTPTRYARRGHIPHSRNFPARDLYATDDRLLPRELLREKARPFLQDPAPLLLYCGGGISACAAALVLTLLGRDKLAVYDGSLEEWAADPSLPLV